MPASGVIVGSTSMTHSGVRPSNPGGTTMTRVMAGAALVALLSAPAAGAQELDPKVPTIVTSGEAVIRRPADQSFVMVSVESHARVPKDAQRMNADAMNAVQ